MIEMNELLLDRIEALGGSARSLYSIEDLLNGWFDHLDSTGGLRRSLPHLEYNNCFVLGGKSEVRDGALIKVPLTVTETGRTEVLRGGVDGSSGRAYKLSYEAACRSLERQGSANRAEALRVSLYLDNAMYGDLHIFVIDFDRFDTGSGFFQKAHDLAGKVTRSQGGGYHMFYGISKTLATPLFDSINLLASVNAKSYVSATRKVTLDGANKVDFFCDARQLIYEWEPWDNTTGLRDRTVELYELIRDNFTLNRPNPSRSLEPEDALWEKLVALGCRTGYPPQLLLEIWEEDPEDQDWDRFQSMALELDW